MTADGIGKEANVGEIERLNPTPDLRAWLRKWAEWDMSATANISARELDFREQVVREIVRNSAPEYRVTTTKCDGCPWPYSCAMWGCGKAAEETRAATSEEAPR